MLAAKPNYWEKYYHGAPEQQRFKRKYSFSDRSRYYFTQPAVVKAKQKLIKNLQGVEIPLTILSQYLPKQYDKIRSGELSNDPIAILEDEVQAVAERYFSEMRRAQAERG